VIAPAPRTFATFASFAVALAVTAGLLVLTLARAAHADGPYDGAWNMSAVSESYTVQQWSGPCGPPPVSGVTVGGGPVTIAGSGGELVISGRRTIRTDQCLDPLPTLARTTHSADGSSWRTRCQTPASDPRRATINTAYFASGDSISIAETGRYEFTINDTQCIADVKRAGSLSRVIAAATTAAPTPTPPPALAPAPTPTPQPTIDCSSPGDPAVLQVRPSRKLVKLGDTFAFRGVVLDSSGCGTGTVVQWSIGPVTFKDGQPHAGVPTIDAAGKLTIPASDFTDATFDVVATVSSLAGGAAGKSAHASVEVAIPADYAALLAQSGLDSTGELDTPAIAIIATSSIGAGDAKAQDSAHKKRMMFIGVIAALVVVLGVVAILGARRAKKATLVHAAAEERHAEKMRDYEVKKQEREVQHAAAMKAHKESLAIAQQQAAAAAARGIDTGPVYCPTCKREYPSGTPFCQLDANRLVAIRGHEQLMTGPTGGVCPACRKGFNPGVKVCPNDGETLVPAAVGAGLPPQQGRGKICPQCGSRFDGGATFCARDATPLAMVN
jgi:hypothetical protein